MTRDLREAARRFSSAAETRIMHKSVTWPQFDEFLASCRELEKVASALLLPPNAADALKRLRIARRKLRTIPVEPGSAWLGLTTLLEQQLPGVGDELDRAFTTVKSATRLLVDSGEHPVVTFITERVAAARKANSRALIHVVVSRDNVHDMTSLDELHHWDLSVTDITGAKRVDTGEMCLVLGLPESLVNAGYFGKTMGEAEREIAWLFNAPIAPDVCVISWPGCRPFKPERYAIFPGATLEVSSSTGNDRFDESLISDLGISERRPQIIDDVVDPSHLDESLVKSRRVWLSGRLFVDYAVGPEGPRPDRITESDFELVVEDVMALTKLRIGDRLVVRGGDAARKFLQTEAHRWLAEQFGVDEPIMCERVRDRFRDGVQRLELDAGATPRLRSLGLTEDQILYRFRLSHDSTHIAPEEFAMYELISNAFGDEVTAEDWDHIRHLRSAMKRAGRVARQKMEEQIAADQSWMDVVDRPEVATLDMGDLGTLLISRIIDIEELERLVPISHLGNARWARA